MLDSVIKRIEEQQKGKEGTPVFAVGEQLKDICRKSVKAAEIVLHDLDIPEMSIEKALEKIKAYADKHHGSNKCFCVDPVTADGIIRKFYGLEDIQEDTKEADKNGGNTKSKFIDLKDFL